MHRQQSATAGEDEQVGPREREPWVEQRVRRLRAVHEVGRLHLVEILGLTAKYAVRSVGEAVKQYQQGRCGNRTALADGYGRMMK